MGDEDKVKILVCGDVDGKFKTLFSRVSSINQKNGPFHFLLCVGDFFGASSDYWIPYKNGTIKVPIPVYLLGPNKSDHVGLYPVGDECELAPNVTYLGKRGVLTSSGLKISYLSGRDNGESKNTSGHTFNESEVVTTRDIALRTSAQFTGVDVLLTSEWPEGISTNDPHAPGTLPKGSSKISWLACQTKPRYHFCGLENVYYERPPYVNHGENNCHSTRFIALGRVGNSDKQKWLYAASLTPINKMKSSVLYQSTTDQTSCPYLLRMSNLTQSNVSSIDENKQYFYDMNSDGVHQEPRGKKRRRDSDRRQHIDQDSCWFCLASPSVEKHLVITIGDEMYLALAKGGLTPYHVMILPVQHHQTSAHLSDSAKKELKKFKSCLRKCFKKKNLVPVYFERNYKSSHLQLQVIPIPVDCVDKLKCCFMEVAQEEHGFELDELPDHTQLCDIAPHGTPYFCVELPDGTRLFYRCRKNFPLHFGRDVVAHEDILNLPDRINWRDCVLGKDDETEHVQTFRQIFSDFDFTK